MTPRELFLLAPHLRRWNEAQEAAKTAYDHQPVATVNTLWCTAWGCTRRAVARGLCNSHRKAR